jgi:DNA repair protein RadA/Sms
MAKVKTSYVCQNCGTSHLKWQGQCSGCQEWGTLVEEIFNPVVEKRASPVAMTSQGGPKLLREIEAIGEKRLITPDQEMNRVLGGGIVEGSVVLLGGEPGIGKSTLLLQLALQLSTHKVLYISGEESQNQVKMRASRLPFQNDGLLVAAETHLEKVFEYYKELDPELIVIDSIQTVYTDTLESAPGSVSQVRESAGKLIRLAKDAKVPIFLVGHITKEGSLAGPKVLEHMVDAVLTFEGDRHNQFRIIRTTKNRFGATSELGIYQMTGSGLGEVSNPSEIFLSGREEDFSGVAVGATLEGLRPLLVEIQALVSNMAYGTAQRSATGFDLRRLNMLLAVLEKRCGFKLGAKDVFINVTGGLRVEDPAIDLALVVAVVSSLHDVPISPKAVYAAEVGLSGEIRSVNRVEQRISEAAKLGFEEIYIAKSQLEGIQGQFEGIRIHGVSKLEEVFRHTFS